MILKQNDLYTQSLTRALHSGTQTIGSTTIQYEVSRYVDMRNLTSGNAFLVTCTQRLIVPNPAAFAPTTQTTMGFINYPALMTNSIAWSDPGDIVQDIVMIDCAPKTANTAVTSNQNQASDSSTTNTQQYSSGSSLTQTNSYGLSASASFSLSPPKISMTSSASSSTSAQGSRSRSQANSLDTGSQFSSDASMSIKDWGSYVQLDSTNTMPTWIWGQEYPWDLIDFRNVDDNGNIILPQYVIDRLYDGTLVYPPSELSQLGVNFASKVAWLIFLKPGTIQTTSLTFTHTLNLTVASHQLNDDGEFVATINAYPDASTLPISDLNLSVLALDPLGGSNGKGLIGFIPGQFAVAPTSAGGNFSIVADSNQLLAQGTGFTGLSQTGFLTTEFAPGEMVTLTLLFKITDSSSDVTLSFKHWTNNGVGVMLLITVNHGSSITRHIDAPEAGSGGDNVTSLPLRRKDFASVDFCDLLVFGLNQIEITFVSDSTSPVAEYTLMAVAVG